MSYSIDNYKKTARELRELGYFNIDLRKKIDKKTKIKITQLKNAHIDTLIEYDKYKKHPEGYVIRNIKSKTARKLLKDSGYTVSPKKLIIPRPNNIEKMEVHISRNKNRHVEVSIIRVKNHRREKAIIQRETDLMEKLHEMPRLKKGQFVTVSIGDSNPWNTRYSDPRRLLHYISQWTPNHKKGLSKTKIKELKNDLISQMQIVSFH